MCFQVNFPKLIRISSINAWLLGTLNTYYFVALYVVYNYIFWKKYIQYFFQGYIY